MPDSNSKKKWTILIYIAADNDLEGAGLRDIEEMTRANFDTEKISVLVQIDRSPYYSTLEGDWKDARRLNIIPNGNIHNMVDTSWTPREVNTGDSAVLKDFLEWGISKSPAERYMVVLWNHGTGWKDDINAYYPPIDRTRGGDIKYKYPLTPIMNLLIVANIKGKIKFDDTIKNPLSNLELKKIIDDVISDSPAKMYKVRLLNHKTGWKKDFTYSPIYTKIDSQDSQSTIRSSKSAIKNPQSKILSDRPDPLRTPTSLSDDTKISIEPKSIFQRKGRNFFIPSKKLLDKMDSNWEEKVTTRAIAFDDTDRDFLDNQELKQVLADISAKIGKKIDIVGFDACLMNMVEVAYQIKDSVDIMVGSEEVEPGAGWPYDLILNELAKNPELNPQDLSKSIVERYIQSYQNASDNITQSALYLPVIATDLKSAIDDLSQTLIDGLPDVHTLVYQAWSKTARFYDADYIDLYDFCDKLVELSQIVINDKTLKIRESAKSVMKIISDGGAVLAEGHLGEDMNNAHGISIYFSSPNRYSKLYNTLDFSIDTKWDDFLKAYFVPIR